MVGVSQLGLNFLCRMLVTDASERASEELSDHPWVGVAEVPADAADCVLSEVMVENEEEVARAVQYDVVSQLHQIISDPRVHRQSHMYRLQ